MSPEYDESQLTPAERMVDRRFSFNNRAQQTDRRASTMIVRFDAANKNAAAGPGGSDEGSEVRQRRQNAKKRKSETFGSSERRFRLAADAACTATVTPMLIALPKAHHSSGKLPTGFVKTS